jgi:hypothetical protein
MGGDAVSDFLAGGGEMGALTRGFDWSKTSLGSPETWPQSLRVWTEVSRLVKNDEHTYLRRMYEFCLPTSAKAVPSGPDWLHEIKCDGFRLRVERSGDRVRLITRGGYDWTKRYPWIVEAALKNRTKHFVIDGEAVILGVDGYSDFNALHSGKHNGRCSSAPSMCWRWMAAISAVSRFQSARLISLGSWHAARMASS